MDPSEYCMIETSRPVNRIALIGHVRASIAEKDWDSYVEIYGIPGVFVVMPDNVSNDKESEYLELAEKAAEQGSGALPSGSSITTTQEARSSQPFQPRLEWIQKQVILAGTGGLLNVLTESGSGTLAGSVHADAFRQIGRGVSRRISEAFQRQIERPRLEKLFPGRPVLAYFDMQPPEYRDQDKAVANVVALAGAGYRMDAEEVSELTGLEVEDVGAPAPAAPPAFAKMRATATEAGARQASPLQDLQATFARLEKMALDPAISDADLQAACKAAAEAMPELLPDLTAAIARPMAMEMAEAAVAGAVEGTKP
jgi:phage gp29-like protein